MAVSALAIGTTSPVVTFTDTLGQFTLNNVSNPVSGSLSGQWSKVHSLSNADLTFSENATEGLPLNILFNPTGNTGLDIQPRSKAITIQALFIPGSGRV